MFARLSIYENVDLDLAERVKHWMESSGVDPFGDLPGYRGSMTLSPQQRRLVGSASPSAVRPTGRSSQPIPTCPPPPGNHPPPMRPESIGLYEIVHRD